VKIHLRAENNTEGTKRVRNSEGNTTVRSGARGVLHGTRADISVQPMVESRGTEERCEEEEAAERNCLILTVTPPCDSGKGRGARKDIEDRKGERKLF